MKKKRTLTSAIRIQQKQLAIIAFAKHQVGKKRLVARRTDEWSETYGTVRRSNRRRSNEANDRLLTTVKEVKLVRAYGGCLGANSR